MSELEHDQNVNEILALLEVVFAKLEDFVKHELDLKMTLGTMPAPDDFACKDQAAWAYATLQKYMLKSRSEKRLAHLKAQKEAQHQDSAHKQEQPLSIDENSPIDEDVLAPEIVA